MSTSPPTTKSAPVFEKFGILHTEGEFAGKVLTDTGTWADAVGCRNPRLFESLTAATRTIRSTFNAPSGMVPLRFTSPVPLWTADPLPGSQPAPANK